jgi:hypothetical protein
MKITATSLLTWLVFTLPASAQELVPPPREVKTTFEIPYKLTGTQHVMVRVKLNGKGPFNFILDTGAPALIMSEEVAKKAKGKLDDKNWGDFKLDIEGGLMLPEAKGLATDMFQLKGMNAMGVAGVELHGVLGYNILAQYRIEYDFTAEKLKWTKLDFTPPKMIGIGKKGDSQGGLEAMGDMMKMLAPLLGLKPNFEVKPRGYLGVVLAEDGDKLMVRSILPGSPAEKSGLKAGDQILAVGKRDSDSIDDLVKFVNKLTEGEKLPLKIKQGEETKTITIVLGKGL